MKQLATTTAILLLAIGGAARAAEPVKIGYIIPLSGAGASDGDAVLAGAKFAVKQVNDKGGILGGRQIELIVGDDATDPEKGAQAAQKVVADQPVAVISSMFSSIAAATKPVVQRAGLLFYSPIAVPPVVVANCDFCFRQNAPIDKMSGATFGLIEQQFGKPDGNKLFMVLESTDYGRMEGKMGQERFDAPGSKVKLVGTTTIAQGAANAQNAVSRVIAAAPDVVYLSVATTETQLLLVQQLRNNGYKGAIVASSATLASLLDAAKRAGQTALVDGVLGIDTWSPDLTNAENKAFVAAYEAATGKPPLKYNEAGYMSVMVVTGAMQNRRHDRHDEGGAGDLGDHVVHARGPGQVRGPQHGPPLLHAAHRQRSDPGAGRLIPCGCSSPSTA